MQKEVYKELLSVMEKRRGPYAGLDIPEFYQLVQELFNPEEALVNNRLMKKPLPAERIAELMKREPKEVLEVLERMADRGLCATFVIKGVRMYKGLPFMPGIFEYQFMPGRETSRDKKIAHLILEYKKAYEAAKGVEPIKFPVTRVIPIDKTIHVNNQVHTYDQVSTYIDKYEIIGAGTCYCRHGAKLRGEDNHDMPMNVCLWFGKAAEYAIERLNGEKLDKQEAMEILDRCEEAGLVHMSRNTTEDIEFLCNCDRWHCEVITHVLKQPKPGLVFNSGYKPIFDSEACNACETCIQRCPSEALKLENSNEITVNTVNMDLCFGCGVCATGCSEGAIVMDAKSDFPVPPKDGKELVESIKSNLKS